MTGTELEMKPKLYVKRLSETAKLPVKGSPASAGYDVHAQLIEGASINIAPGHRALIKTGLAVACPENCYVRVAPRSGLAYKEGIAVLAGVVDADYRGEVGVILLNTSDVTVQIGHHTRIAQLIVERFEPTDLAEVGELPETVRGAGGFGSTGV